MCASDESVHTHPLRDTDKSHMDRKQIDTKQEVTLCIPHFRGHGINNNNDDDNEQPPRSQQSPATAATATNAFVTYEIVVSTAHEIWSVARRCVFVLLIFCFCSAILTSSHAHHPPPQHKTNHTRTMHNQLPRLRRPQPPAQAPGHRAAQPPAGHPRRGGRDAAVGADAAGVGRLAGLHCGWGWGQGRRRAGSRGGARGGGVFGGAPAGAGGTFLSWGWSSWVGHPLMCGVSIINLYQQTNPHAPTSTTNDAQAFVLGVLEAAQTSPQLLGPTVMNFLDAEAGDLRVGVVLLPAAGVQEGEEGSDDDDEDEKEEEDERR